MGDCPEEETGIDFFKKSWNFGNQECKKIQKLTEIAETRSSRGLETTIQVEIALRMQWNASQTPKEQKKIKNPKSLDFI